MSLLKDPSSLVRVRDSTSKIQSNKQIRNTFHVVSIGGVLQCSLHIVIAAAAHCLSLATKIRKARM